jgi:hypothetical protein
VTTSPQPPPEAQIIAEFRERPPRMSIRAAAAEAGISESRWRQIENGVRMFRGTPYPESGPAQTVAKMAAVVGVTPDQLTHAARPDAAGELEAILAESTELTARQKRYLGRKVRRDIGDR